MFVAADLFTTLTQKGNKAFVIVGSKFIVPLHSIKAALINQPTRFAMQSVSGGLFTKVDAICPAKVRGYIDPGQSERTGARLMHTTGDYFCLFRLTIFEVT